MVTEIYPVDSGLTYVTMINLSGQTVSIPYYGEIEADLSEKGIDFIMNIHPGLLLSRNSKLEQRIVGDGIEESVMVPRKHVEAQQKRYDEMKAVVDALDELLKDSQLRVL